MIGLEGPDEVEDVVFSVFPLGSLSQSGGAAYEMQVVS